MPKINVYLPDDLAEAVKETGVPVSAICQRALEQAVRRVTAIRAATLGDLHEDDHGDDMAARLPNFTERARSSLRLAVLRAREQGAPEVGTEHLLAGILAEGNNLALQVLRAMEVRPEQLSRELERAAPQAGEAAEETETRAGQRFSGQAAGALELTAAEAVAMGHNYIGCEHLLVGLAVEPNGAAGAALRAVGADARAIRRTVSAAVAGYAHLRAQGQTGTAGVSAAVRKELEPLLRRIEHLEAQVGASAD